MPLFSRTLLSLSMIACIAIAPTAMARDTKLMLPIATAMAGKGKAEATTGTVQFFFGDQKYPRPQEKLGSDSSNRKTNAFGKSDENACNWVFLGAPISL